MDNEVEHCDDAERAWLREAVAIVEADANRSADTHLLLFPLPLAWGVDLYLKDESVHPTGSLKHRLARSLFLYALCNGWIRPGTTVVEASSGSTAVSEAYFARLLRLPFVAVMPKSTSPEKIALIEFHGGTCHLVGTAAEVVPAARELAAAQRGHFMDQFTNAERATDWRGNNNIAESIFAQLSLERHPEPTWIVVGAGTGGTSATIGRYLRYRRMCSKLCVVDPEGSAFFPAWVHGLAPGQDLDAPVSGLDAYGSAPGSRIEGIGRPRVEPSFQPSVVDRMIRVPDAGTLAAMRVASRVLGRRVGGSTGTNVWGAFSLIAGMLAEGRQGSVVTLLCDGGERYAGTYYSDEWVADNGLDLEPYLSTVEGFLATGRWRAPDSR
jgi:cysteine synthase A